MIIIRNITKYTLGLIILIPLTFGYTFISMVFIISDFIIKGKINREDLKKGWETLIDEWKPIRS